jgi:hypothetical protein
MSKHQYESDVVLGEQYRDVQTGIVGIATAIYFYQFGCERVSLEFLDKASGGIKMETFDAPRLEQATTRERVQVWRTGGPDRGSEPGRSAPSRDAVQPRP